MHSIAWAIVASPFILVVSCAVLYPLGLMLLARFAWRRRVNLEPLPSRISIIITCHNEADELPGALATLLLQRRLGPRPEIIVASDASTDGTDAIAESHRSAGVTLHRHTPRGGKTVVENSLRRLVTGDVVFFMDAASRPADDCIGLMLASFADPAVAVVSSRDEWSAGEHAAPRGSVTAAYLSHEMWLRDLETRAGGIVGASGSLYAIRRELFVALAPHATRDFAAVLLAHFKGMRAVSSAGRCLVRPADALNAEGERLSRTMTQGMATLVHYRRWLRPMADPGFFLKLLCHKVARWLVLPAAMAAGIAAVALAASTHVGREAVAVAGVLLLLWLGVETLLLARGRAVRPWLRTGWTGMLASLRSWKRLLAGQHPTQWEPTRRGVRVSVR